jgi:hypothetical protein
VLSIEFEGIPLIVYFDLGQFVGFVVVRKFKESGVLLSPADKGIAMPFP